MTDTRNIDCGSVAGDLLRRICAYLEDQGDARSEQLCEEIHAATGLPTGLATTESGSNAEPVGWGMEHPDGRVDVHSLADRAMADADADCYDGRVVPLVRAMECRSVAEPIGYMTMDRHGALGKIEDFEGAQVSVSGLNYTDPGDGPYTICVLFEADPLGRPAGEMEQESTAQSRVEEEGTEERPNVGGEL